MARGNTKSDEGAGGLEENDEDPEQGGGEAAGVRIFLQSRRPVGVALWCVDMGGYPPRGTGLEGFPRPGGVATDREATMAEVGREIVVHPGRGRKRGGGVRAN